MKRILKLLILILAYSCSSDRDVFDSTDTYEVKRKELEILYARMVNSEEYKKLTVAEQTFMDKMDVYNNPEIILGQYDYLDWIKKNISKTKFTSIEEAEQEEEYILELTGKVAENHRAVYEAYRDQANHKILNELSEKYDPKFELKKG